jgi:hypothetical protein
MGRKSVAAELCASDYLPILANNPWTSDHLYLPLQYPIHDELRRSTSRLDTSGYDYVGVKDNQSHLVFRRWRTTRT